MKGWLFKEIHEPLELVERPDPVPEAGEIAIDVVAAGLCHSDVGVMEGFCTASLAYYPMILGHEFAGVVSAVGEGVTEFKVGDRVACRAGFGTPGVSMEGAYATKTKAPAQYCALVPDEVDWMQAAAATDAGMTSYHAVVQTAGLKAGDKVGIVGLGGLGLNAAQIAKAIGAKVYAAEIKPEVREYAQKYGFEAIVSDVNDLKEYELDTIIDFAGFEPTILGSLNAVKHGGTFVLIGLGSQTVTLNVNGYAVSEVTIKTSIGGDLNDLKGVFELIKEKKLEIMSAPITFDEIPEGLERLKEGKVMGRLVAMMD